MALTTPRHGFGSEFGISSPLLLFAETPLVSPGESGSVAAAVLFGCYGSRQRVLERGLVWNVDLWKAGMRPCFPTMCASCNLNWRGALEGEDDAAAAGPLLCGGLKGC